MLKRVLSLVILIFIYSISSSAQVGTLLVTAEMGSSFAEGSIHMQQIMPFPQQPVGLRTQLFDASGNFTYNLPAGGWWQFTFCNTSNVCFTAQAFINTTTDVTSEFTTAAAGGGGGSIQPGAQYTIPMYPLGGTNTTVGPSGITTNANGDIATSSLAAFKGPSPWADIYTYGSQGGQLSGTATVNGSTTITLAFAYAFVNGDGITVYGAGPNSGLATPSAPVSATPNQAIGEIAPESIGGVATTGSSTYSYRVVARDRNGGLSAASAPLTITNGQASLGEQSFAVTSASLTGSAPFSTPTLTINTTSPSGIVTDTLFHFAGCTNAALSGMYNVTSVTNANTFVAAPTTPTTLPIGGSVSCTGGTVVYMNNNLVVLATTGTPFDYLVCTERPGDSSYHIIGLTYPSAGNASETSEVFPDFGATITFAPTLPSYITNSVCTQGSATPDNLTTTIVSGAGTTSLVVANAASQSGSGKTIFRDAAVGINAALAFAVSQGGTPTVLIPSVSNFFTYSPITMPNSTNVWQQGNITAAEPIILNGHNNWWSGPTSQSGPQFSGVSAPEIVSTGAWPLFYLAGDAIHIDKTDLSGNGQSLLMLDDTYSGATDTTITDVNCSTGQTTDYLGMCLAILDGGFRFDIDHINFLGGPGNSPSNIDNTWGPAFFLAGGQGTQPTGAWYFHNIHSNGRGIYAVSQGGVIQGNLDGFYMQGGIMPTLGVLVNNGAQSAYLNICNMFQDTSPEAHVALWQAHGARNEAKVHFCGYFDGLSAEAGGTPFGLTGLLPFNFTTTAGVSCISTYICNGGINSQSGSFFNLGADVEQAVHLKLSDQGTCTMSGGACSAQPFAAAYTNAPICQATWTGTGTLAGKVVVTSSTTSVTPSSSTGTDTAQVNWVCFGN